MEKTFEDLVSDERSFQEKKWGRQDHDFACWLAILVEEVGEFATAILGLEQGPQEPEKDIENELIQVAAVTKAIWECGKRNKWL